MGKSKKDFTGVCVRGLGRLAWDEFDISSALCICVRSPVHGCSLDTCQEPPCLVRCRRFFNMPIAFYILYHRGTVVSIEEPFGLSLHRYRHRKRGKCYRKRKEFFGSMKKRMDYAILSGFCAYQRNALRS